ncbi:hypothetical protein EJB05_30939, partial [Eragrostis curvula]
MKLSAVAVVLFALQATVAVVQSTAPGTLTVGYYNDKCNRCVEGIVRDTVRAAIEADSTKGAALIRLLFHDCFVRANLPGSTFEVGKLISNFAAKGFTPEEVVILSGAHSVGRAHCSSFRDRLSAPSTEINPYFRDSVLHKYCGAGPADPVLENNIRDQNATALGNLTSFVVPANGGDLLDNSYYHNNLNNLVLFHSDWVLVGSSATLKHVHEYADNGTLWNLDFADALVKLSKLAMPPGSTGEIRKTCRATN